jgi:hypothetical protein
VSFQSPSGSDTSRKKEAPHVQLREEDAEKKKKNRFWDQGILQGEQGNDKAVAVIEGLDLEISAAAAQLDQHTR